MKFIMHVYFMFRNLNMQSKIISVCMIIIIISSSCTGFLIYKTSSDALEKKVNEHVKEVLEQSTKFTDEKLKSMLIQIHFMQTTERFNAGLNKLLVSEMGTRSYIYYFTYFEPLLTQVKLRDTYINSLQLLTPYGIMADFSNRYNDIETMLIDYEHALNYVKNYGEKTLIHWGNSSDSWINGTVPVIMKVSSRDIDNKNVDGLFVVLNLDKFAFDEYLYEMGEQLGGWVFVLDENNELIFESESGRYGYFNSNFSAITSENGTSYTSIKDEEYLMNWSYFSVNGWKMICIQSEDTILKDLNIIKLYTVISILLVILCISIFALFMAKSISDPMKKLKRLMERTPREGFTLRFNSVYNDEIGQLGQSFDSMSEKIQALIEELESDKVRIKEEQLLKRKAELKALQAQINPHFLYNALDSIYWKSIIKGNKDVGDMAIALSNLFRRGLNKGEEHTTIRKELEHVESYLKIQKIIYEDLFDFHISVHDETLLDYQILKIILQPLVENSILHGFKDLESKGNIEIHVKKEKESVFFSVSDNGKGFDVNDFIENNSDGFYLGKNYNGYALGNVYQRLKLKYGDQCDISVLSQQDEGTIVTITIPKELDL